MSLYGDWQEGGMTEAQYRDTMKWEMEDPDYCEDCTDQDCDDCPLERRET